MRPGKLYMAIIHAIFILMTLGFILPFVVIVIVSISREADIADFGFQLIPRHIDFTAYSLLFRDLGKIGWSMIFTAIVSILAPALVVLFNASIAYPLSRPDFIFRKPLNYFIIFTMMFSGGLIPTYIIYTQVFGLGNNPMIYFVGGLVAAWTIILFRTFFAGIPAEMVESAVIDGATQLNVLLRIIIPMSKPIVGIVYFQTVIAKWNDYQTSLIYMAGREEFYTIQYFMQRILQDADNVKAALQMAGLNASVEIPTMTLRYAMCLISLLPIFVLFPFVQKYFSKGMAVGSVKG